MIMPLGPTKYLAPMLAEIDQESVMGYLLRLEIATREIKKLKGQKRYWYKMGYRNSIQKSS